MVAKDRQGLVEYRPGRIVAVGGVENFVDLFGRVQPDTMAPERVRQLNWLNKAPWRSVVTSDRWKLTLCAADQGELLDLNDDPAETTNLFERPEHLDRVCWMAARLRLWQVETGDTAPLPGV